MCFIGFITLIVFPEEETRHPFKGAHHQGDDIHNICIMISGFRTQCQMLWKSLNMSTRKLNPTDVIQEVSLQNNLFKELDARHF